MHANFVLLTTLLSILGASHLSGVLPESDFSKELCDGEECKKYEDNYAKFMMLMEQSTPKRAKVYRELTEMLSDALKKNEEGREFIMKYKLEEDNPVRSLVARHKFSPSEPCKPSSCTCSLHGNICDDGQMCSELPKNISACSDQIKPNLECRVIKISIADKRIDEIVNQMATQIDAPESIGDQLIDAIDFKLLKDLVRPAGLAAMQIDGLAPKCKFVDEDGKCTNKMTRISLKTMEKIGMPMFSSIAEVTSSAFGMVEASIQLKNTRIIVDGQTKLKELDNDIRETTLRAHEDATFWKYLNLLKALRAELDNQYQMQISQQSHERLKMLYDAILSKKKIPNSLYTFKAAKKGEGPDPRHVLSMRESFKVLVYERNIYLESIECPCPDELCLANRNSWTCTNYCPNSPLCDSFKFECPFVKSRGINMIVANTTAESPKNST